MSSHDHGSLASPGTIAKALEKKTFVQVLVSLMYCPGFHSPESKVKRVQALANRMYLSRMHPSVVFVYFTFDSRKTLFFFLSIIELGPRNTPQVSINSSDLKISVRVGLENLNLYHAFNLHIQKSSF